MGTNGNVASPRWRVALGWIAVAISTLLAAFWAFWGSIENFHEGWYFSSFWRNLALMLVQYLSPMLIIIVLSVVAIRWRWLAIPVFGAVVIGLTFLFRRPNFASVVTIEAPLLLLGGFYRFGYPVPRRWAMRCVIGLPLITALACGAYPAWRVAHRVDDGYYGARRIEGNGVSLVWAPEGPGWPSHYASWWSAAHNCADLTADGRSLAAQPQNIWRLPTAEEAVRSLVYRGQNAGGVWNQANHAAHYRVMPDKDSPLWNVHSQVIYWWTGTENGPDKAYRIAYNGYISLLPKQGWGDYWSYRCVREPDRMKPQEVH